MMPKTNKVLFAMIAKKNLHSHPVNIIAFFNPFFSEKVYIKQLLNFEN